MKDFNKKELAVGDYVLFVSGGIFNWGKISKINQQMLRVFKPKSMNVAILEKKEPAWRTELNVYPRDAYKVDPSAVPIEHRDIRDELI